MTLKAIAARAGVSFSTVSLSLRDHPRISAATRERVKAVAAEMGYVYDRAAATLRKGSSQTVGLVFASPNSQYFHEVWSGVERTCDAAGYVVFAARSDERPERQARVLRRLLEHQADGFIVSPAAGSPVAFVEELRRLRRPLVQILRSVGRHGDFVAPDYRLGMTLAMEHLYARGHRRIAFVRSRSDHSATRERLAGYREARTRHRLAYELVLPSTLQFAGGHEAAALLIAARPRPTAVVFHTDAVALGAMHALQRQGMRVGRDIAFVGFDDIPDARLSFPSLTTVSTDPGRTGEEAARLLLRRLTEPKVADERVLISPRLVVRESSGGA
jgi:LacI family transcriptional regulator